MQNRKRTRSVEKNNTVSNNGASEEDRSAKLFVVI